jgi:hypothetical protein
VIPFEMMRLAQLIHEERVAEALARRRHQSVPRVRQPAQASIVRALRRNLAEALRACAAHFEPVEPPLQQLD